MPAMVSEGSLSGGEQKPTKGLAGWLCVHTDCSLSGSLSPTAQAVQALCTADNVSAGQAPGGRPVRIGAPAMQTQRPPPACEVERRV